MLKEKVAKKIGLERPLLLLSGSFGVPGSLPTALSLAALLLALFFGVWITFYHLGSLSFGLKLSWLLPSLGLRGRLSR